MAEELEKNLTDPVSVTEEVKDSVAAVPETEVAETEDSQETVQEAKPDDSGLEWYAVRTFTRYESKVKADIEKIVVNRNLQDQIAEVFIPTEERVKDKMVKNQRKRIVTEEKKYPGYVFVRMVFNDQTYGIVRNVVGVKGFCGMTLKPIPLTKAEVRRLGFRSEEPVVEIDVKPGDMIQILSGTWAGYTATAKKVNKSKRSVTVTMDIFGRSTDVDIDLDNIQKM